MSDKATNLRLNASTGCVETEEEFGVSEYERIAALQSDGDVADTPVAVDDASVGDDALRTVVRPRS